ncbi:MAG TPA: DUF1428 domain-containing protein [Sphingomonas sp.]|uniref:DUF1428 domain-containing protein n=1 Tax=Sphingomonas sp. TaxID=28214 RepID=UPI002ED79017
MAYIEGFVLAVRDANRDVYRAHAAAMAPLLREWGATRLVECWGDDLPHGTHTDFYGAVKAEPGEVVVFSWIEYPSKAVRDAANAKMMADPRMQDLGPMPFDGKRMVMGGFDVLLDA